MHYKKIRLLFGLVVTSTVIFAAAGCAQTSSTTEDQAEQTAYASAENTFVYTDDTDEELVSTTLTGTVESIDGNEITLNVGMGGSRGQEGGMDGDMPSDMTEGEMPDMGGDGSAAPQDGEALDVGGENGNGGAGQEGDQPGDGTSDAESSEAPEKPDGDTSGAEGSEAPEMPDGETFDTENSETPAKPDGETSDTENSEAPVKPDGETSDAEGSAPSEQPQGESSEGSENQPDSDMASGTQGVLTVGDESVILVETEDGETQSGSLEDITEGSMLQVTFDEDGVIAEILVSSGMGGNTMQGGMGGDMQSGVNGGTGQSSSSSVSYSAVNEYTEDSEITGETITSTGTDENAVLVSDGASVSFQNVTVERNSSDSTGGDNSSFYGVGAAMLVTDGTLTVSDSTITTDAAGGAGVFAYGDGTAYVLDTTISTSQDTSGGIHVAGGGTLYAWDLTVETDGESAAAIRSDRGGGTLVVDGGTYTSNGEGSPALYCTADIAVNGAVLTATGSEAICMEGLNTIHLFDCDITGNMSDLSQNDTTWTVIVYQSMSRDSEVGTSTMQIIGGTLTSENGGVFYTTNTESEIYISGVEITTSDDCEFFLMCTGNDNERGWGTSGANGSQCSFTASGQEMAGDVIWDSISKLNFYVMNGSTLTGAVIDDETYAGNGGSGYCSLYLSADSEWIVTGDSTVTNLYAEGTITDASGNSVTIVGTDGTVYVQGTGSYTITVETYSTTADFSDASEAASWADYEATKPEV
ncbi:MAG: hypothetical protein LUE16_00600 [Lachnospiraceae bacterium]|nr:hypothetical protein [Lachnospiraceae bacterium]